MVTPLLTTKLYVPSVRPELVSRRRLIERLNAGQECKLTLIIGEVLRALGVEAPAPAPFRATPTRPRKSAHCAAS